MRPEPFEKAAPVGANAGSSRAQEPRLAEARPRSYSAAEEDSRCYATDPNLGLQADQSTRLTSPSPALVQFTFLSGPSAIRPIILFLPTLPRPFQPCMR